MQNPALGVGRANNLPAPVGGMNTRDPLSQMAPLYAVSLINWFPRQGEVEMRGGASSFATAMTGDVKTLFQYAPGGASNKLFAATNAGIYNITAGGVIGAVSIALTDGRGRAVNFTNSAGTAYVLFMNGVDTPKIFDGATWSVPTVTGVTGANLLAPWLSKRRVWACEKSTANAWYLPIDSIQGAASKYPLGAIFTRGGYLMAGASWTLDSGDGEDDYTAFISSEGQIAIYRGNDPSSASSWALVGTYYIAKPIGRKCVFQLGGDLGIITEMGVFPLSKAILSARINYKDALTDTIQPTFRSAASLYGAIVGWEGMVFPKQTALLVNVPQVAGTSSLQYVMNTLTGAWSQFSSWAASCFEVFNGELYFGRGDGSVALAWTGTADFTLDIVAEAQQAYTSLGTRSAMKTVTAVRPQLTGDDAYEVRIGLDTDFSDTPITTTTITRAEGFGSSSLWDVSDWDTTAWGSTLFRSRRWRSPRCLPGYSISLLLHVVSKLTTVRWSGTDFVVEDGGVMG